MEDQTQPQTPTPATAAPVTPPGADAPGSTANLPTQQPQPSTAEANEIRETPKKNNTIIIIVLIIVILVVVIGAGFLFLTEQGRSLIGIGSPAQETTTTDQNTSDTSTDTTTQTDYSQSDGTQTVDDVLQQIDSTSNLGDGSNDYDTFDSQAEFGVQ